MTDTIRSVTEKTNADALALAQQRQQSTQNLLAQLDDRLSNNHFSDSDVRKFGTLRSDLSKAEAAADDEIAARRDLATAYAQSEYAKKDADPAVKDKQTALAQERKATKPVMHGKQNLVNSVCQPCLSKEIDSMVDCDTVAMSANEGDFDAVQAYDGEIVSMGAMQKTVRPWGTGELPQQLAEFRDDPATAAVFQRELGAKGFSIVKAVLGKNKDGTPYAAPRIALFFTDPKNPDAKPITGSALDQFIQTNKDRWAETLGPFRAWGRTPEFQRKQVLDFNDRLVDSLDNVPTGYKHPIRGYVTSEMGSALVLDQDVNRPNYVTTDFGAALKEFYSDNPDAARDPSTWTTANRLEYERSIVENYSALRRTTDSAARAAKLAQQNLSSAPGSLSFPQ